MVEYSEALDRIRPLLDAALRPAIWIHDDIDADGSVGQSRVGGTPDLPAGMAWPGAESNSYLDFLLQINLADLPVSDTTASLPRKGMMWLFEYWNSPGVRQLFVEPGDLDLARAPSPEGVYFNYVGEVSERALRFRVGEDLPRWTSDAHDALVRQIQEELALDDDDLGFEILSDEGRRLEERALAKLFGYTGGIGHSVHHDAEIYRIDPTATYDYARRHEIDQSGAVEWRNLLTVHSRGDLCIGDSGNAVVLIRSEDLERSDLTKVYITHESS